MASNSLRHRIRGMLDELASEAIEQAKTTNHQCNLLGIDVSDGIDLADQANLVVQQQLFDDDWINREVDSIIRSKIAKG
jgi:hypothetical protein